MRADHTTNIEIIRGLEMSEENGKVCCNCRHNIRTGETINIECRCDIDGSWLLTLRAVTVMTFPRAFTDSTS